MNWPWNKEVSSLVVIEEPAPVSAPVEEFTLAPTVAASLPTRGPTRTPLIAGTELAEYEAILVDIGIDCCTDLTREKLIAFLRYENIHIYNHTQGVAYLDDKLGADWEWRGLRQADADHMPGGTWGIWSWRRWPENKIRWRCVPWSRPVARTSNCEEDQGCLPRRILLRIGS